ncbi:MAG: hypothetical protein ABSC18_05420 [Verrucomicrobiota bacterium]|jgi:hypothetical protein
MTAAEPIPSARLRLPVTDFSLRPVSSTLISAHGQKDPAIGRTGRSPARRHNRIGGHTPPTYLVKQFNEFRRAAQKTYREKRPYPYSAIHGQIESVFGDPTYYLHQSRFGDLVAFLKQRIDATPAGLRNQRLGILSYHSFEEHKSKSRGEE